MESQYIFFSSGWKIHTLLLHMLSEIQNSSDKTNNFEIFIILISVSTCVVKCVNDLMRYITGMLAFWYDQSVRKLFWTGLLIHLFSISFWESCIRFKFFDVTFIMPFYDSNILSLAIKQTSNNLRHSENK